MDEEEEVGNFRGSTLCGISLSVWLHPPPENEVGDE